MNLLLVCRSLQQTLVEKENEQRELKCRTLAQKKRNSQRKNEQEEEVFDQVYFLYFLSLCRYKWHENLSFILKSLNCTLLFFWKRLEKSWNTD